MEKIKFKYLDIPIIRSCNLGCVGCITHSNHKNIRGVVKLDESLDWLKFWSERLDPYAITLFGGEPLLHPKFADWAVKIRELWGPTVEEIDALQSSAGDGCNIAVPEILVNTNGFYLPNLFDKIDQLFTPYVNLGIIISIHTGVEPSLTKVKNNIQELKQKIQEFHEHRSPEKFFRWELWLDESEICHKQWFVLRSYNSAHDLSVSMRWNDLCKITVCEQYHLPWTKHYTGIGENMRPTYDYHDSWHEESHGFCQAKNFVTLYKGTLYKCPPVGVLEHTLNTFDIAQHPAWSPYLENYQSASPESSDSQIQAWFERRAGPELVCNMCGYAGPNGGHIDGGERERYHEFKDHWNYTL
jgi:Radical SAM superfamily